jgi:hypothetical protein
MRGLLIFIAVVVSLAASPSGYIPPNRSEENNRFPSLTEVKYGGISFQFDKALVNEIKAKTVAASLFGKPCDLWPEHVAFSLVGYPRPRAVPPDFPQLRVFSVQRFRDAVESGYRDYAQDTAYKAEESWTKDFDEEVRVLNALLKTKPTQATVQNFLKRIRHKEDFNQGMPFLPMWEAQQAFISHVKYVNFRNGRGVFFLTQWDTETSQITNDGLEYAFQGITDNGKHYVYAEFSVSTPRLPKGDEPAVIAWNETEYLLPRQSQKYQAYVRRVVAQLQSIRGDEFQPKLELLERLISSLEVQSQ